jgi:hypothetical protein
MKKKIVSDGRIRMNYNERKDEDEKLKKIVEKY